MSLPQHNSVSSASPQNPSEEHAAQLGPESSAPSAHEYTPEERMLLLRLAHDSIRSALEQRDISFEPPTPHLAEPRGVFCTLHRQGQLRGCVGYVLPVSSVYRTVAETARAAAFEDTRFHAVTKEEAPDLEVELSVLSRPEPIAADAVEVGRHGLVIGMHGSRGLLLPQVAVEHGWDRITFLEQTCRKAGLPLDAWQNRATIEAFTAEIFGDKNPQS